MNYLLQESTRYLMTSRSSGARQRVRLENRNKLSALVNVKIPIFTSDSTNLIMTFVQQFSIVYLFGYTNISVLFNIVLFHYFIKIMKNKNE